MPTSPRGPSAATPSFAAWAAGGYANDPLPRRADPARLQNLGGPTMGTRWSLRFDNPHLLPLDAVRGALEAALQRVVAQMSHWEPDSDISRFGRAAAGSRFPLPAEFAQVMACALHWAKASAGAFDPSIGPLVGLWGFGPGAAADAPWIGDGALAAARATVGWERLRFDPAARTIEQPGGLSLDLSAIAKGFAVDHASEALIALGLSDFLLEIGGELRAVGHRPGGMPWQVQVDVEGTGPHRIALSDRSIATSGDRWHRRSEAHKHWSHTIDPRSGRPASAQVAAVSVLHRSCTEADALATVLAVLGPDDGPAFAERHQVAALFHLRGADDRPNARPSTAWLATADPAR